MKRSPFLLLLTGFLLLCRFRFPRSRSHVYFHVTKLPSSLSLFVAAAANRAKRKGRTRQGGDIMRSRTKRRTEQKMKPKGLSRNYFALFRRFANWGKIDKREQPRKERSEIKCKNRGSIKRHFLLLCVFFLPHFFTARK